MKSAYGDTWWYVQDAMGSRRILHALCSRSSNVSIQLSFSTWRAFQMLRDSRERTPRLVAAHSHLSAHSGTSTVGPTRTRTITATGSFFGSDKMLFPRVWSPPCLHFQRPRCLLCPSTGMSYDSTLVSTCTVPGGCRRQTSSR